VLGNGMTAEIYALSHPVTREIRYIGKANDSKKRLASHIRDSRRRDTPVYRWIRKLASSGLTPSLDVVVRCEDWKAAERMAIASCRARGMRLLNVADGGDQPHITAEQRADACRAMNAKVSSDPVAAQLREIKRNLGKIYRDFLLRGDNESAERMRVRLVGLAEKRQDVCGNWLKYKSISHCQ